MKKLQVDHSTVVAITGGAQGIGKEIARAFAATGAQVAIGDLNYAAAVQTAAELNVIPFPLNVTDPGSCHQFVADVTTNLGPIQLFVNNAGVMWVGSFLDEPDTAIQTQVAVNLVGAINGIRAVAPLMNERGIGHIITIASAASFLAPPGEATYTATKHGIFGYLKAIRLELQNSGVELSTIMPGVVDTTLAQGTGTGAARLLEPKEVAAAVVATARRPRAEVTVPKYMNLVSRLVHLLPPAARHHILDRLVPNQLEQANEGQRKQYQAQLTTEKTATSE